MSFEGLSAAALDYFPCKYSGSQLNFRGPERRLDAPYVAFLGGSDTYGKFIKAPFPALVESDIGVNCINFGVLNAGVDVFLSDSHLLDFASKAEATVLQIMGACNLSNRFYTVHPRRNDRFTSASETLRVIYPTVDFAEFHFTKHMLNSLYGASAERFELVVEEVQAAWTARMKTLVKRIESDVVLLWFADRSPPERTTLDLDPVKAGAPVFVTREMLEELRPLVHDVVEVAASAPAASAGTQGMIFNEVEALAAREMLGPKAHGEVSIRLSSLLKRLM